MILYVIITHSMENISNEMYCLCFKGLFSAIDYYIILCVTHLERNTSVLVVFFLIQFKLIPEMGHVTFFLTTYFHKFLALRI